MTYYYHEQMRFDGTWAACLSTDMPSARKSEGAGARVRKVQPIMPEHIGLPLAELEVIYG